jgi:hypothetical protein
MTVGQLWRYVAPASVILFPFGFLAADHGVPSDTWWDEARDPAIWLLILVTVAALAQGVLALARAPNDARATIRADIEQLARRAFVPINKRLPATPINQLGVHVWTTDGDRLTRLVKYTMEQQRATTPITWERGKGAIGLAWHRVAPLIADLTDIYAKADSLDAIEFEALDPEERYGLSADEVKRGGRYKNVLAYPFTDEHNDNEVIGVLSVDCAVAVPPAQLEALLYDRDFQDVLGSCESALRRYLGR